MKSSRFVLGIVVSAAGASARSRGSRARRPRWGPRRRRRRRGAARGVVARVAELPPSPLIFPAQVIPLRFDHARHLKLSLKCETCHVSAPTSTSSADNLIPAEAACRRCHEIDRARPTLVPTDGPAARCDACHVGGGDGRGGCRAGRHSRRRRAWSSRAPT